MHDQQLYMVEQGNAHFITLAFGREDAKNRAHSWFGDPRQSKQLGWNNPDNYTVTPLTEPGDRIHIAVTLSA